MNMREEKYTLIRDASGVIASNLTLEEVGRHILTYDGRQFEVRQDRVGGKFNGCWWLWIAGSRNGPLARHWSATIIYVRAGNQHDAEKRACEEAAVIFGMTQDHGFSVLTDAEYLKVLAEQTAEV